MSKMSELDSERRQAERLTDVVLPPSFAQTARAGDAYLRKMKDANYRSGALRAVLDIAIDKLRSPHTTAARVGTLEYLLRVAAECDASDALPEMGES